MKLFFGLLFFPSHSGLIFFASFRYCEPLNICLKGKKVFGVNLVLLVFFFYLEGKKVLSYDYMVL